MVWYPRWVQTAPPLFLIWTRWVVLLAGPSEVALRLLPTLAALCAVVVAASAYRQVCGARASIVAAAFLAANYWGIKYGAQVKQYATDLLSASTFVLLLATGLFRTGQRLGFAPSAGILVTAALLSFPAVFFFPSVVLASMSGATRAGRRINLRNPWPAAVLVALCAVGAYATVTGLGGSPRLMAYWAPDFPEITRPGYSLAALWTSFSRLLAPGDSGLTAWVGGLLLGLALGGVVQGVWLALQRQAAGFVVLTAGALPLAVGILAGFLRLYPVLNYPRLLIWALPSLGLLMAVALERCLVGLDNSISGAKRLLDDAIVVLCFAMMITTQIVVLLYPRPAEGNREAISYLREKMGSRDCTFIQGGMSEQFYYYAARLRWAPPCIHLGATDWPCCAKAVAGRASAPSASSLAEDLEHAARRVRSGRLWLLLPSAEPGHWSVELQPKVRTLPATLAASGCRVDAQKRFGQTMVMSAWCEDGRRPRDGLSSTAF